jgi:CheY-like chemotaxis protein
LLEVPPAVVSQAVAERAPAPAAIYRRVLVVDDNVDAGELLVLHLEKEGHEARHALDGERALAEIAAFDPHVVLIDIDLPGMSGHELARRLRARPGSADLVMVALTGLGRERDRAESRAAGFNQHWVKPFKAATLMAFLDTLPA